MNPQMDVLYMKGLGHVLGIFTRTAEPVQMETDASAFVGDGLHMRRLVSGQDLVIVPSLIATFRTDRNWRYIFEPFTLYTSGLPSMPTLTAYAQTLGVTFSVPNLIQITLPTTVAGNILVLALDTAGGPAVQFPAQVTASQTSVSVPMTGLVSNDTYNAFVFVPTYPIAVQGFTAP